MVPPLSAACWGRAALPGVAAWACGRGFNRRCGQQLVRGCVADSLGEADGRGRAPIWIPRPVMTSRQRIVAGAPFSSREDCPDALSVVGGQVVPAPVGAELLYQFQAAPGLVGGGGYTENWHAKL
jgi:hypothetical protein